MYVIAVLAPFLAVAAIAALLAIPIVRRMRRGREPATEPKSRESLGVSETAESPVGVGSATHPE